MILPVFLRNSDGELLEIGSMRWTRPFELGDHIILHAVFPPLFVNHNSNDSADYRTVLFKQILAWRAVDTGHSIEHRFTHGLLVESGPPGALLDIPEYSPERVLWSVRPLDRLDRAEVGSWLFPPDADRSVPTPDCDEAKPKPLAPLADWMQRADQLLEELT